MPRAKAARLGRAKCGPAWAAGALGHRLKPARIATTSSRTAQQRGAAAVAPAGGDDGGAEAGADQGAEREEAVEGRHGRPPAGRLDLGRLHVHGDVERPDGRAEDEQADEEQRDACRPACGSGMKAVKASIMTAVGGREPKRAERHAGQRHGDDRGEGHGEDGDPQDRRVDAEAGLDHRDVGGPDAGAEAGDQEGVVDGEPGAQEAQAAGAVWRQRLGGLHGGDDGHGADSRRIRRRRRMSRAILARGNQFPFPVAAARVWSAARRGAARCNPGCAGRRAWPLLECGAWPAALQKSMAQGLTLQGRKHRFRALSGRW